MFQVLDKYKVVFLYLSSGSGWTGFAGNGKCTMLKFKPLFHTEKLEMICALD